MDANNARHAGFQVRNAQRWAPAGWRPYAGAACAVALAAFIRFELHPVLQSSHAFTFFTVTALLVEFFLGLGPALLAVLAGLLIATYFFVPPYNTLLMPEPLDFMIFGGYLLICALAITLIEALQRSKYAMSLMADVLQSRLEMLERSNLERERAERQAQENSERFRSLAASFSQILFMRRVGGDFEYLNEAFYRHTGLAAGTLGDAGWLSAIHPQDTAGVAAASERVGRTGQAENMTCRLRMADGRYETFSGPLSRIEGKHGKDIKWIGSLAGTAAARPRA